MAVQPWPDARYQIPTQTLSHSPSSHMLSMEGKKKKKRKKLAGWNKDSVITYQMPTKPLYHSPSQQDKGEKIKQEAHRSK